VGPCGPRFHRTMVRSLTRLDCGSLGARRPGIRAEAIAGDGRAGASLSRAGPAWCRYRIQSASAVDRPQLALGRLVRRAGFFFLDSLQGGIIPPFRGVHQIGGGPDIRMFVRLRSLSF
jgi:hypothetical protein